MQSAWHLPSAEDKPSIQGTSALSPNDVCAGVCVTGVKYMCVREWEEAGPAGGYSTQLAQLLMASK